MGGYWCSCLRPARSVITWTGPENVTGLRSEKPQSFNGLSDQRVAGNSYVN